MSERIAFVVKRKLDASTEFWAHSLNEDEMIVCPMEMPGVLISVDRAGTALLTREEALVLSDVIRMAAEDA